MWSTLKKIGNVVAEGGRRGKILALGLLLGWLGAGSICGDEWRSRYENTPGNNEIRCERAVAAVETEGDSGVIAARHLGAVDSGAGAGNSGRGDRKRDDAVRSVGYTGIEPTPQLRWLPVRPKAAGQADAASDITRGGGPAVEGKADAASGLMPLQFIVPSPAELGGGSVGQDDPLADPFGDAGQSSAGLPPVLMPQRPVSQSASNGQPEVIPPPMPLGSTASQSQPGSGQPSPDEKSLEELMDQLPPGPKDERPLEEQLTQKTALPADECPPQGKIKPLSDITNDIRPQGDKFPTMCPLPASAFEGRNWQPLVFTWKASGLCHKPLYFEQVGVERYGHNLGPILQPFASGAHFFLTVPILPYKMGLEPPGECIYTLGYYRPGSCAPWILDPLPLSVRAALAQGGVWTGMAFLIP